MDAGDTAHACYNSLIGNWAGASLGECVSTSSSFDQKAKSGYVTD
jgi:hypothetical protein